MSEALENIETFRRTDELVSIFRSAVRKAQSESRRLGVPNVYSLNGQLYYELPSGEYSRQSPSPGRINRCVNRVSAAVADGVTHTPPSKRIRTRRRFREEEQANAQSCLNESSLSNLAHSGSGRSNDASSRSPAAAGELFDAAFEGFQLLRNDFDRCTLTDKREPKVLATLGRSLLLFCSFTTSFSCCVRKR